MTHFIDRRLNPKGRSTGNRRRFIGRIKAHVREAVDASVRKRGITDMEAGTEVSVPRDSLSEPSFRHASKGGLREGVLPGNRNFRAGDEIERPPPGGGGAGRKGAPDGEGEDDFVFALSRDEFLDIFFEDLELPDLIKRSLAGSSVARPRRAGLSVTGSPANLNVGRTMRRAMGRRIALRRPSDAKLDDMRERLFALEAVFEPDAAQRAEMARLQGEIEAATAHRRRARRRSCSA